jgi:glycosyltransferase involved in cell wall biosynthesis
VVSASLPPDYGGAEIAAYRYVERLARNGGDAVLLAQVRSRQERANLPSFVHPVAVPDGPGFRLPLATGLAHMGGIARRLWPAMYRLRHRYQIVHIFNSRPLFNLLAVPAARALHRPVVLETSLLGSDDPVSLSKRSTGVWLPRPTIRSALYRWADVYVSKSLVLTSAFRESGLASNNLYEIPYAVDVERFRPATRAEKRSLRERLGLPESGLVVLFVGGMNPRKCADVLLRAFRQVSNSERQAFLVLVGPADKYDPVYVEGLYRYVREESLGDRIAFVTDVVRNVEDYMRASDLFVLPSSREGLPIAILEAMSCGLAVIASDIPEIAGPQIHAGTQGELVPVGDADALADRLTQLLRDEGRRKRLGAEARRRIQAEFAVDVVDRQYGSLYARLTARRVRHDS